MKLMALYHSLNFANERQITNLEIETDSSEVITKKLGNPLIRHSFREGNKLAHLLATQGTLQGESNEVTHLLYPP
ncbi:hypothetical protein KY289_036659 [Solanum tuberosum]|nr:hypothetical protein KY284_036484 [Solanum tuberosum]KAH0636744.1 hypothetical protein KY289_036659 [Solanum tuberosum]